MVWMLGSWSPLTVKEWMYKGVDVGVTVTIDSEGVDV